MTTPRTDSSGDGVVVSPPDDAARAKLNARGLRQLVSNAPHPTFLIRPDDGTVVESNAAAAEMLGRPLAELSGVAIEELIAPDSRRGHRMRREAFAAAPVIGPMGVVRGASALTREGSPVPVEIGLSGIETAEGPLMCATLRDVSDDLLRERQDAALHRVAAAATSEVALDALLAMVVDEAAGLLAAERALLARFDPGAIVVVGCHGDPIRTHVGEVIPSDSGAALAVLARTGATAQMAYADLDPHDPLRDAALREGREHAVAVPIDLPDGRWGGLMVATARPPSGTEVEALQRFAELAGVLISAAQGRAVEQALRDSEESFRQLADFVPQLVWTCDETGRCDFLNRRWEEYTGVPAVEQLGDRWLAQVHPDDRDDLVAAWSAAVAGSTSFVAEFRLRRSDGTYRPFDTRAEPLSDASGTVIKWFGSNTDVAGARAAEKAVRESEVWLRAALEAGRMGAWSHDLVTGRSQFDRQCRLLLAIGEDVPDDELGERIRELIDPADMARLDAARARALEEGDTRPHQTEFRVDLPGAGRRWLTGHSSISLDSAGRPRALIGVMLDVTAEREAGERALRSQKLEALGTLAGGIAHDFNNLLQVVGGNVALARAALPAGDVAEEHLSTAERATRRAADLVGRILSFSRPDEEVEREPVALEALVADALELLRPTLPAMIALRASAEPGLPAVLGDPVALTQVVTNLATNAAQAIGRRPGVVEFRVERLDLTAEDIRSNPDLVSGDYVRLTVGDDGPGMDAATLALIFDPFFTTKEPGSGTGLGLSIVHAVMRAHGGAVTAYSSPGKGAAFHLYFPVAAGPAVPQTGDGPAPAVAAAPRRGARILFVDDERDIVELHEKSLARAGHVVTGHTDPREAVGAFRAHPSAFDAVITDLSMPGMTGLEVAREVLALRPDIPVLIASGYIPPEERAEAEAIGVRVVIPKPSPLAHVREVLEDALG